MVKADKDAEKHYVFNTFADIRKVATIGNDYVYGYYFNNPNQQEFAPFITSSPLNDDIKKQYRFITDAFYETARYMILNNKKKTP